MASGIPQTHAKLTIAVRPGAVLRSEPSVQSRAVRTIFFGSEVHFHKAGKSEEKLLGVKGVWYEVYYSYSDQRGWIFAPLLRERGQATVLVIQNNKLTEEMTSIQIIVHDKRTNLSWTSCNSGQTFGNGRCNGISDRDKTSFEGKKYCEDLKLNGLRWQLPSLAELRTIADSTFGENFPYSEMGPYVSATEKSSEKEDYFMSLDIPERTEHSYGLDGSGIVKCFARK